MAERQEQYIIVNRPDRGLQNDTPAPDLDPRQCSSCSNVFFEDGLIKKRFGWGVAKTIKLNGTASTALTEEVLLMQLFDESYSLSEPNRRVIALTKNQLIDWDDANAYWEYRTTVGITQAFDDAAVNTAITKASAVSWFYSIGTSLGHPDIRYSWTDNAADATYDVRIKADITKFEVSKDGGGYGGDYLSGTDEYTDANITIYVNASSHSIGDSVLITYDHTNRPALSMVTTPTPPVGTYCLKIEVAAGYAMKRQGIIVYFRDKAGTGSVRNCNRISFWMYHTAAPGVDVQWALMNGLTEGSDGLGVRGLTNNFELADATKNTWIRYEQALGVDVSGADFANGVWMQLATVSGSNDEADAFTLYLCDVRVEEFGGSGLGESVDSRLEPTLSTIFVGTIGNYGSRLIFTHKLAQVRYIDTGASRSSMLANADYNTSRTNHQCRALGIEGSVLHLYATVEEDSGTDTYHLLRDRSSALADADIWDSGIAGYTDITQTPDEILNVVTLGGNDYIFKSNSIIRSTFTGGETEPFIYQVVYTKDGLIAPRLVIVVGNYAYFVGRNNVYRYTGSGLPQEIGDPIKTALFADLEYSSGQYHRRSWIFDVREKEQLWFVIPTASGYPDKAYVWDYHYETWTIFDFTDSTNMTAGTSYYGLTSGELNQSAQFGTSAAKFYELDFTAESDYADTTKKAIDAQWTSKAFGVYQAGWPELTEWTQLWFRWKGDNITVSVSTDGVTFTDIGIETSASTMTTAFMLIQKTSDLLWIRFSDANEDSTFQLEDFGIGHIPAGIQN